MLRNQAPVKTTDVLAAQKHALANVHLGMVDAKVGSHIEVDFRVQLLQAALNINLMDSFTETFHDHPLLSYVMSL
jgi:hypothetical protein